MDTRAAVDNAEKQAIIIVERDGGRFTHLASDYQPGMVLAPDSFKPDGYVQPGEEAPAAAAKASGKGKQAPTPTPTPSPVVTPAAATAPTLTLPAQSWSNGAFTAAEASTGKFWRTDAEGKPLIASGFDSAELAAGAILPPTA